MEWRDHRTSLMWQWHPRGTLTYPRFRAQRAQHTWHGRSRLTGNAQGWVLMMFGTYSVHVLGGGVRNVPEHTGDSRFNMLAVTLDPTLVTVTTNPTITQLPYMYSRLRTSPGRCPSLSATFSEAERLHPSQSFIPRTRADMYQRTTSNRRFARESTKLSKHC